jgi:hypothetical protein
VTPVIAVVVAASVLRGNRTLTIVSAVALAWSVDPLFGAAGTAVLAGRLLLGGRRVTRNHDADDALLADLTVLGLSAGLTFPVAAGAAADIVDGDSSTQLRRALRLRGTVDAGTEGDPALMIVARRALSTGAPLIPAVSGYASRLRDEERSRQLSAARRLPVKLLFPLALLILPGFLVLTIGPAVLGSLERLGL